MTDEKLDLIACPACRQSAKRERGKKNNFDIYDCRQCGTLYSSKKESAVSFDYDEYYTEENLVVPDFVIARLREIVRSFIEYRVTNRFLDVGCGAGTLLKVALEENWAAEGTEISQSSVEFLQKQNIKVFDGELAAAGFSENSFDVVAAVEILEHIPDPGIVLKDIYRVLRPGGLLWATTPHGAGISSKLLGVEWTCVTPPEHLHLFSVNGIKNLLAEVGFRHVTIAAEGVNPFEIVHALRKRRRALSSDATNALGETSESSGFDRVETAYELNMSLSKSPSRRAVKNLLNQMLSLTRMGDSLKIRAEK